MTTQAPVAPTADPSTQIPEDIDATLKALNIRPNEYTKIKTHLQRDPNFVELVMFSNLWSEHCSYKHTKHLLKTLPTEGPQIVQGPGENAGIVDVGEGLQVSFKVESHNHPTYVEPFQGAATGVGGILRDIITMNARPVALLNALRFGPLYADEAAKTPTDAEQAKGNTYRFGRAIEGISHYGNCMGIPTIGGDVLFDPSYSKNPLVNVMAIGQMEPSGVMKSGARGTGYPVLYVGSPTGKDGMGGASFASRSIETDIANEDRPAVQVGDPFAEKLLLESCLEVFKTGAIVASQDMGAAGLTCATAEMAAKGEVGIRMDLDKVPAREPGMCAWEFMASESQERMLMVVQPERLEEVVAIFDKWQVPSAVIGEVTEGNQLTVFHHGQQVVDLPVKLLTDMAPEYAPSGRPAEPASFKARREREATEGIADLNPENLPEVAANLMGHLNIASRLPVYQQYDRHVRNNTVLDSDNNSAGLIRLRKADGGWSSVELSACLDGNPYYSLLEPYQGALGLVAESARNLVATGCKPLAVTDNLNFGDPEDPEIYYQLYFSVAGLKEACKALNTPVTGGNVSLYNLNETGAILPSPVIGMVGVKSADKPVLTPHWKQAGDKIALLGRFAPSLGGSVYQQAQTQGEIYGSPPSISINDEARLNALMLTLHEQGLLQSAQDVSLGGLLPSLLECSLTAARVAPRSALLGFSLQTQAFVEATPKLTRHDVRWFGETHGTYIISYKAEQESQIQSLLNKTLEEAPIGCQLKLLPLGQVTAEPNWQLNETKQDLEPYLAAWLEGLRF